MRAVLIADGAARGNPGPAGIGVVLRGDDGRILAAGGRFLGEATNNVAEYTALIEGLRAAQAAGVDELDVRLDSELVTKQMRGEYRVKHPNLKPLHAEARRLASRFRAITFTHVPRSENEAADGLCNEAIDDGGDVGFGLAEPEAPSTLF